MDEYAINALFYIVLLLLLIADWFNWKEVSNQLAKQ